MHCSRAVFLALLVAVPAFSAGTPVQSFSIDGSGIVGIDEKLGEKVPFDLKFHDEDGQQIVLGRLVTAPTILALVYYNCPNVCDLLLTGIAGMLRGLDAAPGRITASSRSASTKPRPPPMRGEPKGSPSRRSSGPSRPRIGASSPATRLP